MGFLSSIKRLLFAQKSVAKSAADKSVDYAKEKTGEIVDKTTELAEDAGATLMEKTSGLRDAVMNTAEDLMEKGKDLAEDASEYAGDMLDKGKEMASDAYDKITDNDAVDAAKGATLDAGKAVAAGGASMMDKAKSTAEAALDKTKEVASDAYDALAENELVQKAGEVSESVGDKVLDAGEAFMEKAKSVSESVGEKVLDKGGDLADKAKSISETVGEKVLDAKDDLVERAKEFAGDMGEKLDATIEKAQKMEAEEAAKPKREFAEDTIDAGDSLLDGTDDFFAKADKFASGDYDAFSEGKITIKDESGIEIKADQNPSKPTLDFDSATTKAANEAGKAAGFNDLDGDGNELIDDAIISDDE